MAQFTKVNSDFQPVQNYDSFDYTNNGLNAVVSAATVQPQGPKLDFFTVTATGAFTTTQIATIVQTVQQLATIYLYEYTDTTNDTFAMAVYPVAGWTASDLNTALTNAGVTGTTTTATATFTG